MMPIHSRRHLVGTWQQRDAAHDEAEHRDADSGPSSGGVAVASSHRWCSLTSIERRCAGQSLGGRVPVPRRGPSRCRCSRSGGRREPRSRLVRAAAGAGRRVVPRCPSRASPAPGRRRQGRDHARGQRATSAAAYQAVRDVSPCRDPETSTSCSARWSGRLQKALDRHDRAEPVAATRPRAATARRTRPRVTSSTPQQARTTSASAAASGDSRTPSRESTDAIARAGVGVHAAGLPPSTQGLLPATAASAPEARPSSTTGPKVRRVRVPVSHRRGGRGRRRSRCGRRCGRPRRPGRR